MNRHRGRTSRLVAVATAAALAFSTGGCVSSGGAGGQSALDSAAARCVASVIGGALVGGLIGAAAGGRNSAAIGAASGAAFGGVACAVIATLDAQDKARIRQAQIEAAASNQPRYLSYNGGDGRARQIVVRPRPVSEPTQQTAGRVCRETDGSAAVQGAGATDLPAQLVCRTTSGDWVPA